MAEEKEKHMAQIRELEASVAELLSKSGGASHCRVPAGEPGHRCAGTSACGMPVGVIDALEL